MDVGSSMPSINTTSVSAAMQVMKNHIDGINARDAEAIAATLHFPHFRLIDGRLNTWLTPDSYLSDFRARAGSAWSNSAWGRLDVVHASEDKVHLDVQVERFSKDGELIVSFPSLWVIAKIDNVWAAQLRSSFAPDAQMLREAPHHE